MHLGNNWNYSKNGDSIAKNEIPILYRTFLFLINAITVLLSEAYCISVVNASAKILIFKQITTADGGTRPSAELLMQVQRY